MRNIDSLKYDDFKKVYTNGKSYANKYLVMYILNNGTTKNRIGISVSKKVGNSIVRHRLARLIRETYRLNNEKCQGGFDIVVIARGTAKGKSYWDIASAYMHLIKLHKIKIPDDSLM